MADEPQTYSDDAWDIASKYSCVLASETRDLAGQIDALLRSKWQPIESAPKDGTWFVGIERGDEIPTVMQVRGPASNFDDPDAPPRDYDVVARALNTSTWTRRLSDFTHWMPLPESPLNR